MSLKRNIREYFSYSTTEKRGLLVLVVLVVVAFIVPFFMADNLPQSISRINQKQLDSLLAKAEKTQLVKYKLSLFNPNLATEKQLLALGLNAYQVKNILKYRSRGGRFNTKADFGKIYGISATDFKRYKPFIVIPKSKKKYWKKTYATKRKKTVRKAILFSFNPNKLSVSGWDSLGVDKKIALRIKKYIAKGGKFKTPADLAKMYGLKKEKFEELKPYVSIPKIKPKVVVKIDLNTADTTLLKSINGIGSKLAARIVAHRKKLKGFIAVNQLSDIYGFNADRLQQVMPFVKVDAVKIEKININTATVLKLQKHPYISRRVAQDIVRYRKRNGKFSAVKQLKDKHLLLTDVYEKVSGYLSCE